MLSMALAQYLDNAAKYSFAGTMLKVAAWESHSEVLISVHNFGPPIPIVDRERIFQRFYRSEGTMHRAPGTGIGLSTVKMAAEAHQGHVWVISNTNEGTTFFLSLPQQGGESTVNRESGNLLIVDDERSIRLSLRTILCNFGFEIVEAARGRRRSRWYGPLSSTPFCWISTCPEWAALRYAEHMRRNDPRLPIVMLTVQESEDRKVEALDAGADDYITKPFQLRELTARLRAAVRRNKLDDDSNRIISIGDVLLDPDRHMVEKKGRPVHLTPKQFEVLHYLMVNAGQTDSSRRLLRSVWGPEYGNELEYLTNVYPANPHEDRR